ncbi:MAG: carboxypeptidase-like regulatory domain-containing protein [Chitinophagaceae bacterium]
MNRKLPACFYLLFISLSVFSQQTIKGRVVNASTGEALAGSSVFINSTSIGTVADRSGNFELNNIPSGRYDLVISLIGYETNVFTFTSAELPLNLKVEMNLKVKELENVTVEPWVEEGWDKWGLTFTESFVGRTPNAANCKIKNTNDIHFRYYKKTNRLTAYSDEPLVVENKALGYTIRYQLEQFEIDFKNNTTAYMGYPFFEEIDKNRKGLQRRWKEAREKAFYGSIMHFMQSLFKDSLVQNGYEVRRMKRLPNDEKERVKIAYRNSIVIKDSANRKILREDLMPKDSLAYYHQVMRQKDYIEIYGKTVLTADSLIVKTEGEYKILFFLDYLYITYKNELEDKAYLLYQHENRSAAFQRSYIWLVSGSPISLDIHGNYYPPQELFSMGYWGWEEKTANLLPSDYLPGN